jgi:hypothetical protein
MWMQVNLEIAGEEIDVLRLVVIDKDFRWSLNKTFATV